LGQLRALSCHLNEIGANCLNITLEAVTVDNFETLLAMELPPDQDRWIASNACSIAQASFYPEWLTYAICCDGKAVGFLLYDIASGDEMGQFGIYRFMVDFPRQGQGIGRRAMNLLLAHLRAQQGARRITICYKPENTAARGLYLSCGFMEVGVDDSGEMIAEIRLTQMEPATFA
jgi:diamine N-acetyltransferase